jgi:lipid II:glycine glycyltransferase (peptidoglycan interpeptide bridge formation enzyme)
MNIDHPLHTSEWAKFQKKQGHVVYQFDTYILVLHRIPHSSLKVGTISRGPDISQEMLDEIKPICLKEKVIFVKIEPNVVKDSSNQYFFKNLVKSPKVNFYPHSIILDITPKEEELLDKMHPKTRYNIRVANRHGVKIIEDTSDKGFKIYLDLLLSTSKRQGFFIHNKDYHRNQWDILKKTDIPHIFLAKYQNQILSAFMIFKFKNKIYYPYGASLDIQRQVMAPNLMMWEVIKWGKKNKCISFDMWGSLAPDAKEGDFGYGFHRFKLGYGGQLVEFVGTYDFIINPLLYRLYLLVDYFRWKLLRLKAKIHL